MLGQLTVAAVWGGLITTVDNRMAPGRVLRQRFGWPGVNRLAGLPWAGQAHSRTDEEGLGTFTWCGSAKQTLPMAIVPRADGMLSFTVRLPRPVI